MFTLLLEMHVLTLKTMLVLQDASIMPDEDLCTLYDTNTMYRMCNQMVKFHMHACNVCEILHFF